MLIAAKNADINLLMRRIAHTFTDVLLARADGTPRRFYSMSAEIRLERNEYYKILEKSQRVHPIQPFEISRI